MHYEELHDDLPKAIAKIASFLGIKASPEFCEEVAKKSSMKAMKKQAAASKAKEASQKRHVHLRKGKVGNWRARFSEEVRTCFFGSRGLRELRDATSKPIMMVGCDCIVAMLHCVSFC
uniref:Sulfotransferase domain-containing protein n=1 Tax=Lotharella globosa TaxID=91324 RepID=A0A7S3Z3V7_9EUKA